MQLSQNTLFALLVSVYASSAIAQESGLYKIQITERGVYRAQTIARKSIPGTTGLINTVQNAQLVSSTTLIPGALGVRFGVRYQVSGLPGSMMPLRLLISFPPSGLRNPATGQMFFQNEHLVSVPVGIRSYWEYHFENEWEIVPGVWHFEFWSGQSKLTEQRFCVQVLSQGTPLPGAARECRYDLLGHAYSAGKRS